MTSDRARRTLALAEVAAELTAEGFGATFNAPDADDPLGGVLGGTLAGLFPAGREVDRFLTSTARPCGGR